MKKQNKIAILALASLLLSCGGGKKQTLGAEEVKAKEEEVTDFASTEIFSGERKEEIRRVDPTRPPVTIDISGELYPKGLKIATYYSKLNYIKLQHPNSSEGENLKNPRGGMEIEVQLGKDIKSLGSKSSSAPRLMFKRAQNVPWPTILKVEKYKNWILVGSLSGLFCYDIRGNYLYTLLKCNEFEGETKKYYEWNMDKVENMLAGFSVADNVCAFVSCTDGKATLHSFDLRQGKETFRKKMPSNDLHLISGKRLTYLNYSYEFRAKEEEPFMYSITAQNDTVCSFYNGNILIDMTGMSTIHNPGFPNIYHFDDQLHVKQQGNDTIFRFKSEYEINPAYIFNTGQYKATIQNLIKGQYQDKRYVNKVVDTEKLVLFSIAHSKDIFYFDKTMKKVYFSNDFYSDEDAALLPLTMDGLSGDKSGLYGIYTKEDIDNMAINAKANLYTSAQKRLIEQWANEVNDGELLFFSATE